MSSIFGEKYDQLKAESKAEMMKKYFGQFADNDRILTEAGYGDLVGSNYWDKLTYKPGILDNIIGSLGGRTGEDKFWENAAMQYGEYQAGLLEQMHQEKYDSPLEQSARMRQAGQNPDLLGTGDVSQSPGLNEDSNNVLPDGTTELNDLVNFASGIGRYFQGALGMISTFQQLGSGRLALKQQRTDLERNNMGFALDFILNHTPEEFPEYNPEEPYVGVDSDGNEIFGKVGDFFSDGSSAMRGHIKDAWLSHQKKYGGYISKRDWKQIDRYMGRLINSLPTTKEQYAGWRQQALDKLAYGQARDSEFYSKDFDELLQANMEFRKKMDEVQKLVLDLQSKQAQAGSAQAGYQSDYYSSLNGSDIASMETGQLANQLTLQDRSIVGLGLDNDLKRIQKKVNEAKNTIVRRWSEQADAGNPFAKFMLWQYSLDQSDPLGIGAIQEQANTQATIGSRYAGSIIP